MLQLTCGVVWDGPFKHAPSTPSGLLASTKPGLSVVDTAPDTGPATADPPPNTIAASTTIKPVTPHRYPGLAVRLIESPFTWSLLLQGRPVGGAREPNSMPRRPRIADGRARIEPAIRAISTGSLGARIVSAICSQIASPLTQMSRGSRVLGSPSMPPRGRGSVGSEPRLLPLAWYWV